jgi:hypothetical protein
MSTRSAAAAAAASGATRKRRSPPTPAADGPAKRRSTRAAPLADPPTLVPVAPPAKGDWCTSMQPTRDAGEFIDIVLVAGERRIPAHKNVLVSLSPYLHGMLTSGLAESKQGGDELKIGDADADGHAVSAIVDCMYAGRLSLSLGTVCGVIRTANLFGVDAVEKAACDFFVDALEPSTACEALAFSASRMACGEQAVALHMRCASYVVEHFAECSVERPFLDLPSEAVAELIGSDDLPVEEASVVAAVRAWFDHDAVDRQRSLRTLVSLIRWPLLPGDAQLKLANEPLLQRMMVHAPEENCVLGASLLLECSMQFAKSDAAAACPRLKRRKGTAIPLAFTAMSRRHYATGEDGALLTANVHAGDRPALCRERVMNSGQSCAEFTVVRVGHITIGVGRPTLDTDAYDAYTTEDFWGLYSQSGHVYHNDSAIQWQGQQGYGTGDVLRLLLDSDAGTLTVKKNGTLLGVAVTIGLTGDLCWAVSCLDHVEMVRIKALDPAEF